jgi:hypothetical protein
LRNDEDCVSKNQRNSFSEVIPGSDMLIKGSLAISGIRMKKEQRQTTERIQVKIVCQRESI